MEGGMKKVAIIITVVARTLSGMSVQLSLKIYFKVWKAKKGTTRAARLNWDRSARQTRSSARARTWHWVHRSRFSSSWSGNERETQQQSRKSRGGKNPAVGCLGCSQSPLPYMARWPLPRNSWFVALLQMSVTESQGFGCLSHIFNVISLPITARSFL